MRRPRRNLAAVLSLAALLLAASVPGGCASLRSVAPAPTATPASPLPHSMKGYELYSWHAGDGWRFTLITGTNRTKAYDEITAEGDNVTAEGWVKITVTGGDALKAVLARLPRGEFVAWVPAGWRIHVEGGAESLGQPDQATVGEIQAYARQLGLEMLGP